MSTLLQLIKRYRDSDVLLFSVWCIIGIGIVPAIVTESIFPLGILSYRFGVAIEQVSFLTSKVCLLIFCLAAALCVLQKRYLSIFLLIPWLALFIFDIDQLTVRLPAYSQAQDVLVANYQASKETKELPEFEQMLAMIDAIDYPNNPIMPIDIERLTDEVTNLQNQLSKHPKKRTDHIDQLLTQIHDLNEKINATDKHIQALENSKSWLPFYSEQIIAPDIARRSSWVEQRNLLRAELNQYIASSIEFYELHAEILTSHWVSHLYESWRYSQVYKIICFVILLILIWCYSLSSWVFIITLSMSAVVSIFYVETTVLFRLWMLTKFLLSAWVIRALFRLWQENYSLVRQQSKEFILSTLGKSIMYYWLFIVLIFITFLCSLYVDRYINQVVYSFKHMSQFEPNTKLRRKHIDSGIDLYFDKKEEAALARLDKLLEKNPLPGIDKVAEETNNIFDETFAATLPDMNKTFREPDCGGFLPWVFDAPDCAEKGFKKPINDFYKEKRNYYANALLASTKLYSQKAGNDVHQAVSIAKQDLHQQFLDLRLQLKARIYRLYSFIDFWYWVSLLIFILVILKSFFYIFARVFFADNKSDHSRVIQFEPSSSLQAGSVEEKARLIQLTDTMGKYIYVNKHYDFANSPPDEITPQAHKALFSRYASKTWHMNRVQTASVDELEFAPYRRIPDDERFIVWTLKPGDAVIFSWRNFVGMNEQIKIRTQFSWQLSSLLLGRMFYVVAHVPSNAQNDGTLILLAKGSDGLIASSRPANNPDQLLAWQTTTRFDLHANISMRNIYRSGIQVRAKDNDLAIMHQNSRRHKSGAVSFIKYFLLPV